MRVFDLYLLSALHAPQPRPVVQRPDEAIQVELPGGVLRQQLIGADVREDPGEIRDQADVMGAVPVQRFPADDPVPLFLHLLASAHCFRQRFLHGLRGTVALRELRPQAFDQRVLFGGLLAVQLIVTQRLVRVGIEHGAGLGLHAGYDALQEPHRRFRMGTERVDDGADRAHRQANRALGIQRQAQRIVIVAVSEAMTVDAHIGVGEKQRIDGLTFPKRLVGFADGLKVDGVHRFHRHADGGRVEAGLRAQIDLPGAIPAKHRHQLHSDVVRFIHEDRVFTPGLGSGIVQPGTEVRPAGGHILNAQPQRRHCADVQAQAVGVRLQRNGDGFAVLRESPGNGRIEAPHIIGQYLAVQLRRPAACQYAAQYGIVVRAQQVDVHVRGSGEQLVQHLRAAVVEAYTGYFTSGSNSKAALRTQGISWGCAMVSVSLALSRFAMARSAR